jgi:hypothetical protein
VTKGWRKLCNEVLQTLYSSLSIVTMIKSKKVKWAGHTATMRKTRNAYKYLVRKSQGKGLLTRPRHRWENNIKMDLRETGCDDTELIQLLHDMVQW